MYENLPGLDTLDVVGRRVLVRTDYNVEIEGDEIIADLRLRASIATLECLLDRGARVLICSHRGRPHGRVVESLRNAPLAPHIQRLLGGRTVIAASAYAGKQAEAMASELRPGEVLLLENVRFDPGEEANDREFAQSLADLADAYVLDAFGAVHRAHASIVGVPNLLPSAAGLLVQREVSCLSEASESPSHPVVLILGGAKVVDKLPLLEHLLPIVDTVCIGGAPANAVLAAQGREIGQSTVNGDHPELAIAGAARLIDLMERADHLEWLLPDDVIVTAGSERSLWKTASIDCVSPDERIVDLGPASLGRYTAAVKRARTVIWNGPIGWIEQQPFDQGSVTLARAIAEADARAVIGGGETAGIVRAAGLEERMWHVSTGGGAALQFLSGQPMPGLDALLRGCDRVTTSAATAGAADSVDPRAPAVPSPSTRGQQ
jgi:phosphoglycerate kinase